MLCYVKVKFTSTIYTECVIHQCTDKSLDIYRYHTIIALKLSPRIVHLSSTHPDTVTKVRTNPSQKSQ